MRAMRPVESITNTRSPKYNASSTSWVYHDHGALLSGPDALQLALELEARERVERTEGFVEEQKLGLVDQGARDRRPLSHATGELVWIGAREGFEMNQLEVLRDELAFALGRESRDW